MPSKMATSLSLRRSCARAIIPGLPCKIELGTALPPGKAPEMPGRSAISSSPALEAMTPAGRADGRNASTDKK